MDNINALWLKLLTDYASISTKSDKTSSGYPAFIAAAKALVSQCYGVLSSLSDIEYTVDGGDPFTQIIDSEYDCNGGYPGS